VANANASITWNDFTIISGKLYMYDTQANYMRTFNVSTQAHISGEDVNYSTYSHNYFQTDGTTTWLAENDIIRAFDFDGTLLQTFLDTGEAHDTIVGIHLSNNNLYIAQSDGIGSNDYINELPAYVFPTALVQGTGKDFVSPNIGLFWERSDKNFQKISGSNLIYFSPIPAAPYFERIIQPLSEVDGNDITGVLDLRASIQNYSEATGQFTQDGSVTILATGSNTPFTYSFIGASGFSENSQSSSTFSSLNAGKYTFRVTNSKGINYDLEAFTLPYRSTSFQNYGLIYTHQFYSLDDALRWRVEIYDRDSSDNNTNIDAGTSPIIYSTRGEGRDIYENTILAAEMQFQLHSTTNDGFSSFATADDEKYASVLSKFNGATWDEKWRGYMNPESYSQQYGNPPRS
jgi:hypothetical protein